MIKKKKKINKKLEIKKNSELIKIKTNKIQSKRKSKLIKFQINKIKTNHPRMNPVQIYFKEINIDQDQTFTINFTKENEIESLLFDGQK